MTNAVALRSQNTRRWFHERFGLNPTPAGVGPLKTSTRTKKEKRWAHQTLLERECEGKAPPLNKPQVITHSVSIWAAALFTILEDSESCGGCGGVGGGRFSKTVFLPSFITREDWEQQTHPQIFASHPANPFSAFFFFSFPSINISKKKNKNKNTSRPQQQLLVVKHEWTPGEWKAPLPFTAGAIQQNSFFASSTGKHHMARAKQGSRGGVGGKWAGHETGIYRGLRNDKSVSFRLGKKEKKKGSAAIHKYVWQRAGAATARRPRPADKKRKRRWRWGRLGSKRGGERGRGGGHNTYARCSKSHYGKGA